MKTPPSTIKSEQFKDYILPLDEVYLFELFINEQVQNRHFPFYLSSKKIEEETRIKRRRVETIIKKFISINILSVEIKPKDQQGGKNRYYFIDIEKVINNLSKVIKEDSTTFNKWKSYLLSICNIEENQKEYKEYQRPQKERKNKSKENNNKGITETYKQQFIKDSTSIQSLCLTFHLEEEKIKTYLDEFIKECREKHIEHKNIKHFTEHFKLFIKLQEK